MSIAGVLVILSGLAIAVILTIAIIVIVIVIAVKKSKNNAATVQYQQPPLPAEEITKAQPKSTLGEIIKNHRVRCGMTQEYVAEALNVSRQAVSKWETDSAEPSTSNLLALAKLFGISAAELLQNIE